MTGEWLRGYSRTDYLNTVQDRYWVRPRVFKSHTSRYISSCTARTIDTDAATRRDREERCGAVKNRDW